MALVQGLFLAIARSAVKILNTVFGWAISMLFGKVPQDRQVYLSVISFGSVIWIIVLLGIAFPNFGTLLLTFIKPPDWVNDNIIRLVMLVAAVVIPIVIGLVSQLAMEKTRRPKGFKQIVLTAVKGYPYTLGLALTLVMMVLFAPFLKIGTLIKGWQTQHTAAIVDSEHYMEVVGQIESALSNNGYKTTRHPASWMMRLPTKVLTSLAGGAIEKLVADKLTELRGKELSVMLHPSDIVISGKEKAVAHARSIIAEQLAFSPAYMTWTKESNELEDRMESVWKGLTQTPSLSDGEAADSLHKIEHDLKKMCIPFEEWEPLFRQLTLLQRALLQRQLGLLRGTQEPAKRSGETPLTPCQLKDGIGRSADEILVMPLAVAAAAFAILGYLQNRREENVSRNTGKMQKIVENVKHTMHSNGKQAVR